MLCLELVIVCAMWLAYFLDIVPAGIAEERRTQRRWTLTHLPLHLATVALSVGVGSYLTLQPSSELSSAQIWVLAGPLAVIFLSFAALGWTAPRRPRSVLAALRITAALAIVVASLAMRGSGVDSVKVVVGVFGLVLIGYTASAAALRHRLATAR